MTDPLTAPIRADTLAPVHGEQPVVGGRYRLRTSIGHGGMGTVWRATDLQLGREVAVKEVAPPPGTAPDEQDALHQRLLREARAAAVLSHPGIVQVYDVVTDGDRPWVVMELLDARSLATMVREDGPLAPRAVAKIGVALLGALEVAHAAGVLHRDVKPANVLICVDGRCVLTDFGVARLPTDQQLTTPGMVLGSPHFISPERAMGARFGPPSDLFSLGVTLFLAVEGQPPFDKGEPIATMHAVVEDPPRLSELAGPLTPVLYGLLEKDPSRRWDIATTRNALRELLAGPLASEEAVRRGFPTDAYATLPDGSPPAIAAGPGTRPAVGGRALLTGPIHTGAAAAPVSPATTDPGAPPVAGAAAGGPAAHPAHPAHLAPPDPMVPDPAGPRSAAPDPYRAMPDAYQGTPDPYQHPPHPASGHSPYHPTGGRPPYGPGGQPPYGPGGQPPYGPGGQPPYGPGGRPPPPAGHSMLAPLRRLPRPAVVALAAVATAAIVLAGVVVLVALRSGGGEAGANAPGAPSAGPGGSPGAPVLETQTYQGRGVVVNVPAGWEANDQPDLVFVDFTDPADEDVEVRLVVEDWSADPHRLAEVAEQNISSGEDCAPYQRVALTETEVAGMSAAELEYTCGGGADLRRARWVSVVHEGTGYSMRFTAPDQVFADRQVIYDELLRSFQLAT